MDNPTIVIQQPLTAVFQYTMLVWQYRTDWQETIFEDFPLKYEANPAKQDYIELSSHFTLSAMTFAVDLLWNAATRCMFCRKGLRGCTNNLCFLSLPGFEKWQEMLAPILCVKLRNRGRGSTGQSKKKVHHYGPKYRLSPSTIPVQEKYNPLWEKLRLSRSGVSYLKCHFQVEWICKMGNLKSHCDKQKLKPTQTNNTTEH